MENKNKDLMMLTTDMAMITDKAFKVWSKLYVLSVSFFFDSRRVAMTRRSMSHDTFRYRVTHVFLHNTDKQQSLVSNKIDTLLMRLDSLWMLPPLMPS